MKRIRLLLAAISAVLLAAGYAASQLAYFQGTPDTYAAKVDQGPVIGLTLLLFLVAVVLGFLPDREDEA